MILISLPDLPPSVNKGSEVHRNKSAGSGAMPFTIGKTRAYRKWIEKAAWHVAAQRKGECLAGPVEFRFMAKRPCAASDLDNRLKPIIDACQHGGAIQNDNQIVRIVAEWDDACDLPTVILESAGLRQGRAA